jgi:ribonuclease HI
MTLYAFTDGASRGNPGASGIGIVVKDTRGTTLYSTHGYIGVSTNNRAEYIALLTLLEQMRDVHCRRLVVHSDSELMVRQVNGEYKVKDSEIRKYHRKITEILAAVPFEFELTHVPRERNADADRLANFAIDDKTILMPEPFPPLPSGGRGAKAGARDRSGDPA